MIDLRREWIGPVIVVLCIVSTSGADGVTQSPPATVSPIERLSDEASRAVTRLYDYDLTIPLEARIVEQAAKDGLMREKIVFRGVQGFLAPGYLQMPKDYKSPMGCVLLLHGWSGSKEDWWRDGGYVNGGNARRALLEAGFAVFALDAQCHGDRASVNDFAPVNHYIDKTVATPRKGYFTLADIYIQTVRDYRRAIDYLETRPEIDKARIGVLGYSMGGTQTFVLTGVEPRIKAAVAVATPAEKSKWSPVAPQNFVRSIGQRPFLTIIGRSDELCPLAHAIALQTLIESKTKDQVFFDARHKLPVEYVPHAASWLKVHL